MARCTPTPASWCIRRSAMGLVMSSPRRWPAASRSSPRRTPVVPLGDRPLLYHLMKYLAMRGVRRFVLCVGYKAEVIEQFAREETDKDWDVRCVNSGVDAAMADRVIDAKPLVSGPCLICY